MILKKHSLIALAFLAFMSLAAVGQATVARPSVAVDPQLVQVSLFYEGTNIKVRAEVPAGDEAAIKLMSSPERMELKKLGKKLGVLWMGAGSVTFENIPAVYQVLTSAPLADLGPRERLAEHGLGYESLIPQSTPGYDQLPELVRLKEHEGFYAFVEGGMTRSGPQAPPEGTKSGATGRDLDLLQGTLYLPASAPPGEYSVILMGFGESDAAELGRAKVRLEYTGVVKELKNLAINHGLIYGIGASLFAVIVGFLIGILFQQRSDESH